MADDACTSCGRPFGEGLAPAPSATVPSARRWVAVVRELVVLNVLFIAWRIVGHISLWHAAGAFSRGRTLWHLERLLRLPSEATLQRQVLGHPTLDRALNGYYEFAHAGLLVVMLLWLLLRHRDSYAKWRNVVVAFTAVSLAIGLLPVAPPRLVPQLHLVDLADRFHQSVYGALGSGITDQLSCLPSVHVGWAVIVALAVVTVSRSRWRWLAVLHPLVTAYVVVVTANHYWLDGVAALVVLAGVLLASRAMRAHLLLTRP
jgi:hypothetical protein